MMHSSDDSATPTFSLKTVPWALVLSLLANNAVQPGTALL